MKFKTPSQRIMVALDVDELSEAKDIVETLKGYDIVFKVGNQLGTFEGWNKVIDFIHGSDAKIFCDTKFKDIPATVKKSSRAITRHSPDFFNIMADNNESALSGAVQGRESSVNDFDIKNRPILLGVTVLTSISDKESIEIYGKSSQEKVLQFATNSKRCGLDGIVCSAQEASLIRQHEEIKDLILVTPGIRPKWASSGDQARVLTPKDALKAGADYLVIGRPITKPPKEIGTSRDALEMIISELEENTNG